MNKNFDITNSHHQALLKKKGKIFFFKVHVNKSRCFLKHSHKNQGKGYFYKLDSAL